MGHKKRGPSGPTPDEQFQSAQTGYRSRARDFAAEGGGQVDVDEEARYTSQQQAVQGRYGNKQGALDDYKKRMEEKFKTAAPALRGNHHRRRRARRDLGVV